MKAKLAFLFIAACIRPAFAQGTVEESAAPTPPASGVITETTIERTPQGDITTKTVTPFDPAFARRHLLVLPRDAVVETTETKQYVEIPGQPRRVYNIERNVVVVEGKELSYITIPVLFEKETAKLLDVDSRIALGETASAILEVLKTHPTAVFDIEGHTSTDGTNDYNLTLSGDRARRVHLELTKRYLVPATSLRAHGYGELFPNFPGGTEQQMELDRRVLVVRAQ